jgi:hypothetical protein
MNTSYAAVKSKLIGLFVRIYAGSDTQKPRDARVLAEDLYRERMNTLKRFFDGNEMPVGYVLHVLRAVAGMIGDTEDLVDADGKTVNDGAALDFLFSTVARDILDSALRAETEAHQNLLKLFKRNLASRAAIGQRGPERTPDSLYWEWIGRCESFFSIHQCEPARAHASMVIRRLAKSIDEHGLLLDRDGREVKDLDAYVSRISLNVLHENRRVGAGNFPADPDGEEFVAPESDRDDEELQNEARRECRGRCLEDLTKRYSGQCKTVQAYTEASGLSDKEERRAALDQLARDFRSDKAGGVKASISSEEDGSVDAALNYLRVNVCRMREKLESVFRECVGSCLERKAQPGV